LCWLAGWITTVYHWHKKSIEKTWKDGRKYGNFYTMHKVQVSQCLTLMLYGVVVNQIREWEGGGRRGRAKQKKKRGQVGIPIHPIMQS